MKKLVTLLAAAGMVVAASAPANAVDVKADGSWRVSFKSGETGFTGENVGMAQQRLRLGITATASENLSGYFQFQFGKDQWGTNEGTHGEHLKGSTKNITLRQSYIDWTVPATSVKVRMGRFALGLPEDAVSGNAVLSGDFGMSEGIVVSAPVTDWLGLTAMWNRAGYDAVKSTAGYNDLDKSKQDDIFAAVANLKFNGVSGAVYAAYGAIDGTTSPMTGGLPEVEGDAYWVGFTSTITAFDPFTLKLSASYGNFDAKADSDDDEDGWNVQAKASYKLGFGTPVVAAWYFSGDDKDGQGAMPNGHGYFFPTRTYHDAAKGLCGGQADAPINGNWGVQVGIEKMSFLSGLTHDFLVTYIQGTNDEKSVDGKKSEWYLSENDSLVSFDLINTYNIYKNLAAHLEFSYIISDFDKNDWNKDLTEDDWRAELTFQYKF